MSPLRALLSVVIASAAVGCGRTPPAPAKSTPFARVDSLIEDVMAKRDLPGMTVVVVQGDSVTYVKGYGKADLASGRPVTTSTPFVIGSTSKTLAALAALKLVADHKVALDTPIVRYVPELEFTDARANAITLRQLLTNRSGMATGFSGAAYKEPRIADSAAVERLAHQMAAMPLRFAPGTDYLYSNRGWALVGYIVQRVSGTPIEDFMAREVFQPLGMTHTTLEFWKVPDIWQGYVEGRAVRNHPHPASLSREYGPSGMIVSTAPDVGNLLVALQNHGRTVLGTQFLTPELIAEALRPQADAHSELGGPTKYGLGWEVDSMFGTTTIRKGGSVASMVTLWVMLPEKRLGLGFSFNREDYRALPVIANVVRVLTGAEPTPFPNEPVPPITPPEAKVISKAARQQWVGRYDTKVGDVDVYERGDSLLTNYDGAESTLVPINDSTFTIYSDVVKDTGSEFQFRRKGGNLTMWQGKDSVGVRFRK